MIAFGATIAFVAFIAYLPFLISFPLSSWWINPKPDDSHRVPALFPDVRTLIIASSGFLAGETYQGLPSGTLESQSWFDSCRRNCRRFIVADGCFHRDCVVLPESRTFVSQMIQSNEGGAGAVLSEMLKRQLQTIVLPLFLIVSLIAIVARLFSKRTDETDDDLDTVTYFPATGITLLLIAGAFGVTLVPEFVYLRDNFGNTHQYDFQILLSSMDYSRDSQFICGLRCTIRTAPNPNGSILPRIAYGLILSFVIVASVPFLPFGMYTRAVLEQQRHVLPVEQQAPLTLDGRGDNIPVDYFSAVQCLGNLVQGDDVIVAEASQNTYNSSYGRLGAFYGLPTVINWENHERQWRGDSYGAIASSRRPDIDRLYSDLRWDTVVPIIEQYEIDYIMYGATERSQYGESGEDKFLENLTPICEFGQTRVYVVSDDLIVNN